MNKRVKKYVKKSFKNVRFPLCPSVSHTLTKTYPQRISKVFVVV